MEEYSVLNDVRGVEFDDLKKRLENLRVKIMDLTNQYYTYINLVDKTDGNIDNVPIVIRDRQKRIDSILYWTLKTCSMVLEKSPELNPRLINFELQSYEMAYESSFKEYGKDLAELISLYTLKEEKVSPPVKNEYSSAVYHIYPVEENTNYKVQIMNMLSVYNVYGVTDENLVKFVQNKKFKLEEKAQGYLNYLSDTINSIMPLDLTSLDVSKIKKVLSALGRMHALPEEYRERAYQEIELYIDELSNRKSRSK